MDYLATSIKGQKMMHLLNLFCIFSCLLLSCNTHQDKAAANNTVVKTDVKINPYKQIDAIPLPSGFERIKADTGSFAFFLRHTALKQNTTVYLYNGQPKTNQNAQYALLDISVGHANLQQCADAVMRLRAEYLFAHGLYQQIIFRDNAGTAYIFDAPYTREHFNKYLIRVFGMCGSASLAKQLKPVDNFSAIQPGDVLIRGGFPGHAVIVMDVAVNSSGNKIYLLAQSYMPAQDIHVLKNPMAPSLSPWYEVNDDPVIQTPEYSFVQQELRKW